MTWNGHGRRRGFPAALLATLAVALCIAAAACGGGATPATGVASIGTTTATTDPPTGGGSAGSGAGGGSSKYSSALAYSQCMRSHGVANFPDPQSNGGIQIQAGPNGLDPNSAQFKAADQDCRHLLPNGGQPSAAQRQQMLSQALKFSRCMRSHGFPNFPDPTASGGGVSLKLTPGSGVDPNSSKYKAAQSACSSFLPGRTAIGQGPSGGGSGGKAVIGG